jgi:hypothetical protein
MTGALLEGMSRQIDPFFLFRSVRIVTNEIREGKQMYQDM